MAPPAEVPAEVPAAEPNEDQEPTMTPFEVAGARDRLQARLGDDVTHEDLKR